MQHQAARSREPMSRTVGLHSESRRSPDIRIVGNPKRDGYPQDRIVASIDQVFVVPETDEFRAALKKKGLHVQMTTIMVDGMELTGVAVSAKYFRKLSDFRADGNRHLRAFYRGDGVTLHEYSAKCIQRFGLGAPNGTWVAECEPHRP